MNLNVVIPVIRHDFVKLLMQDLADQVLPPDRVIIIDNSCGPESLQVSDMPFPVELICTGKNAGVNGSWNIGISRSRGCDVVSILNDDIRVGKRFLEYAWRTLKSNENSAAACPRTANRRNLDERPPDPAGPCFPEKPYVESMSRREGWAMTFKRSALDRIPPIPDDRIKTFCGDDWLWHWSMRLGMRWYKFTDILIYHHVGASMLENPEIRQTLNTEKAEFRKILEELS